MAKMTEEQRRLMIEHGWMVGQGDLSWALTDHEYNADHPGAPAAPNGQGSAGQRFASNRVPEVSAEIARLEKMLDDMKQPRRAPSGGSNTLVCGNDEYAYQVQRECSADRSRLLSGG